MQISHCFWAVVAWRAVAVPIAQQNDNDSSDAECLAEFSPADNSTNTIANSPNLSTVASNNAAAAAAAANSTESNNSTSASTSSANNIANSPNMSTVASNNAAAAAANSTESNNSTSPSTSPTNNIANSPNLSTVASNNAAASAANSTDSNNSTSPSTSPTNNIANSPNLSTVASNNAAAAAAAAAAKNVSASGVKTVTTTATAFAIAPTAVVVNTPPAQKASPPPAQNSTTNANTHTSVPSSADEVAAANNLTIFKASDGAPPSGPGSYQSGTVGFPSPDGSPWVDGVSELQSLNKWRAAYKLGALSWNASLASASADQLEAMRMSDTATESTGLAPGETGSLIMSAIVSNVSVVDNVQHGFGLFEVYIVAALCSQPADVQLSGTPPNACHLVMPTSANTSSPTGPASRAIILSNQATQVGCGYLPAANNQTASSSATLARFQCIWGR